MTVPFSVLHSLMAVSPCLQVDPSIWIGFVRPRIAVGSRVEDIVILRPT